MIENFKFKKQFGQNFITDTNLLSSIVADSEINNKSTVVEVGAGAGALTNELCKVAKKVVSFEIDRELVDFLTNKFEKTNNLELIFKDALKISNEEINNLVATDFDLVANLPYYITSPLIFKFLENENCKSLTVMVQKEVATRIVAKPSSKDYGVLSVKLGALANCKICRIVSRKLFNPQPNVDSAIIRIEKKENNLNYKIFNDVVNACFAMRRKTLQNNLTSSLLTKTEFQTICEQTNIAPGCRAENLTIEQFIQLSQSIEKIRQ